MKHLLVFLLLGMLSLSGQAQEWNRQLNYPVESSARSVELLDDGSILSLVNSEDQVHVVKYDQQGVLQDQRMISEGSGHRINVLGDSIYVSGTKRVDFDDRGFSVLLSKNLDILEVRDFGQGAISFVTKGRESTYFVGIRDDDFNKDPLLIQLDDRGGYEIVYDLERTAFPIGLIELENEILLICKAAPRVNRPRIHFIGIDRKTGDELWRKHHDVERAYSKFRDYEYDMTTMAYDSVSEVIHIINPMLTEDSQLITADLTGEILSTYTTESRVGIIPLAIEVLPGGDLAVAGIRYGAESLSTDRTSMRTIERRRPDHKLLWKKDLGLGAILDIEIDGDTVYLTGVEGSISPDDYSPVLSKVSFNAHYHSSRAAFLVYEDTNGNCQFDANENALKNIGVTIDGLTGTSDEAGRVELAQPAGTYGVDVELPSSFEICEQSPVVTFLENTLVQKELGIRRKSCAQLDKEIFISRLIRCDRGSAIIQVNNSGSIDVEGVVATLIIEEDFSDLSSDYPFVQLGDELTFDLDGIAAGEYKQVELTFEVSCDLDLHASYCFDLEVTPSLTCDNGLNNWEGPLLETKADCQDDVVTFQIRNAGNKATDEPLSYSIYANGHLAERATMHLGAGEVSEIQYVSEGLTLSLVMEQDEAYPGNSILVSSIEGCGRYDNLDYAKGFKQMFTQYGVQSPVAKSCKQAIDVKRDQIMTVLPSGLGRDHFVNFDLADEMFFDLELDLSAYDTISDFSVEIVLTDDMAINEFKPLLWSTEIDYSFISQNSILIEPIELEELNTEKEFVLKFPLKRKTANDFDSLSIIRPVVVVNGETMDHPSVIYNRTQFFESSDISPDPYDEDVLLFSKATDNNFRGMVTFDSHSILWGFTDEHGEDFNPVMYFVNNIDELMYAKEVKLAPGRNLAFDFLRRSEEEFWVMGYQTDVESRPFANFTYAFIWAFDQWGNEKWGKYWKPGTGEIDGGSITESMVLDHNTIVMAGDRFLNGSRAEMLTAVDSLGEVLWVRDFLFDGRLDGDFTTLTKSKSGNILMVSEVASKLYFFEMDANSDIVSEQVVSLRDDGISFVGDIIAYSDTVAVSSAYRPENSDTYFIRTLFYDVDYDSLGSVQVPLDTLGESITDFFLSYVDGQLYLGGSVSNNLSGTGQDAFWAEWDIDSGLGEVTYVDANADEFPKDFHLLGNGNVVMSLEARGKDYLNHRQFGYTIVKKDTSFVSAIDDLSEIPENSHIFPNPTSGRFTVKNIDVAELYLYDMQGVAHQVHKVNHTEYDASHLPKGTYVLLMVDTAGLRKVRKLLVQ